MTKYNTWSSKEIRFLMEHVTKGDLSRREIVRRLERTQNSVNNKIWSLGMGCAGKSATDVMTLTNACRGRRTAWIHIKDGVATLILEDEKGTLTNAGEYRDADNINFQELTAYGYNIKIKK